MCHQIALIQQLILYDPRVSYHQDELMLTVKVLYW